MHIFYDITQVDPPVLNNGQVYIYVLKNEPQGNVKIGRSSNMQQRLQSLSGSNSGGNHITKIAISDATWLYSLERLSHIHFAKYRITGTEWFRGIMFDDAITYIDSLFSQKDYVICNQIREKFAMAG